jgi:hypothetical protein
VKHFVSMKALRGQAPKSPDEIIAEIRRIYFKTTRQTIHHDLAHAIELLKSLPDEETRDRAAVYMDGLSQMRAEFAGRKRRKS